jgi:cytochrome c oxidase subunit I
MTLTASTHTSPAVDAALFGNVGADDWVSTSDHQRIGQLHFGLVLGAVLIAGALGVAVHGSLAEWFTLDAGGSAGLSSLFALHQNLWAVAIGLPLWVAVGTLVVPGQIGATRLAFPRMASFSLWGWIVGVATMVTATLVEDGPMQLSLLSNAAPTGTTGAANQATDLALASVLLIAAATLAGAINLVATILTERRVGLKLAEVNPFSWSVFVTMTISVLSTPVFMAGVLLVYLDQHFGGQVFASGAGADRVWIHLVWLYGRPETILIALPAIGAVAGIIVARTGRSLVGGSVANLLLSVVGALSLTVWAGRELIGNSLIQPYSRFWVRLAIVPLFLLLLVILGSVRGGLKPDVSLLFALGVILSIAVGALMTIVLWAQDLTPDTAFAGQLGLPNLLVFGVALLGALGIVVETAPDSYRSALPKAGTSLAGLAVLGGVLLSGAGLAAGSLVDDATTAHAGAAIGKALITAGAGLLVLTILGSAFGRSSVTKSSTVPSSSTSVSEGSH